MMSGEAGADNITKRYELKERIGQGGMGTVFRAYDRLTGELVALKRVLGDVPDMPKNTAGDNFRMALAQEFKLLATMHHPNVIEVRDYGFDSGGQPYFTMELLHNPQTILQASHRQPVDTILSYIMQMLQAIEYLHRRGVLHRDLKPANVLVVEGVVKVLDFGLSEMRDKQPTQSDKADDVNAGTIAYMSPEVLLGNAPTEAADLYAVGVMMYEILNGHHPFNDTNITALINDIIYKMPDTATLDVPLDLVLIIERLLQKEPDVRYLSARDVMIALNYVLTPPLDIETTATRESFIKAARLIGRDEEIHQLTHALEDALSGRGSMWLIAGESGVGKSRLVDEIRTLAMVRGALVMRGAVIAEGKTPYHSWRNVLRWLALLVKMDAVDAGLVRLLVPDVITLPPDDVQTALGLDPQKVQARLLNLIQQSFVYQNSPIVILLEDLHWAGSEDLALLNKITSIMHDVPLLVIASYRDDERPDLPESLPPVPIIKLGRLNEAHIAELSQAMLGHAGRHPQVVDLLRRETEGNVFFLVEVVRALAEEVGELEQIGRATLPQYVFTGGIKRIVQRRLDHVPPELHDLLAVAAIIGRELDLNLLRLFRDGVDVDKFLLICANAAVLESHDGVWQFSHDKLREGVIERLTTAERNHLHQQLAQAIELTYAPLDAYAAILAYHWGRAGEHQQEAHYATIAGEQALRSGAYQQAIDYFERALYLMPSESASNAAMQTRRIQLQHRKAEGYLGFGGYMQARQIYQQSLTLSEKSEDMVGLAASLLGLGNVEYARAIFESAERYYQRSLDVYRHLNDESSEAKVLNSLGNVAYELGRDDEAKILYQESLNISRRIGDQWGMAGALPVSDAHDESHHTHDDRRRELQAQLLKHKQRGSYTEIITTLFELGVIAFQTGEDLEAQHNFQQIITLVQSEAVGHQLVHIYDYMGQIALRADEPDKARHFFTQSLHLALEYNMAEYLLQSVFRLAQWMVMQNPAEAVMLLSFIMGHPDVSQQVEDSVERMVFDLEVSLDASILKTHWEQGKSLTLDEIFKLVQSIGAN